MTWPVLLSSSPRAPSTAPSNGISTRKRSVRRNCGSAVATYWTPVDSPRRSSRALPVRSPASATVKCTVSMNGRPPPDGFRRNRSVYSPGPSGTSGSVTLTMRTGAGTGCVSSAILTPSSAVSSTSACAPPSHSCPFDVAWSISPTIQTWLFAPGTEPSIGAASQLTLVMKRKLLRTAASEAIAVWNAGGGPETCAFAVISRPRVISSSVGAL